MRNAVCKKEMKLSVRTKKNVWGLFIFNGILAMLGLLVFYVAFGEQSSYSTINYSRMLEVYIVICLIEMCLVAFIVPSVAAGSIAGEREKQTLEILLTTRLTSRQIIWGKLLSSISTLLLYIISSIPILAIVFSIGGVSVLDLLQVMLYICVLAVFFCSFGILYSCLFKKSIVATICTYGTVFVTTVGPLVWVWVVYVFQQITSVNSTNYISPDVGHWAAVGLISPIYSVSSLFCSQIGSAHTFYATCVLTEQTIWGYMDLRMWFVLTIVVQLGVAFLALLLAAKRLNPIKKAKKKKEK